MLLFAGYAGFFNFCDLRKLISLLLPSNEKYSKISPIYPLKMSLKIPE